MNIVIRKSAPRKKGFISPKPVFVTLEAMIMGKRMTLARIGEICRPIKNPNRVIIVPKLADNAYFFKSLII
jgi:hypothetical protein